MRYVAAFDGGGTKTRCIIGDEEGNILADLCMSASNHQTVGSQETRRVIGELLCKALAAADLDRSDLSYAFAGLAGADMPSDFELLKDICGEIFGSIPFKVVNDVWIVMRSGLRSKWGAAAICGTGSNCAAVNPGGERAVLRALSYMLGGYGGGNDIAVEALHFAFRSDEGTGTHTLLEEKIPEALGFSGMEELLYMLYPENKLGSQAFGQITPLVFELANRGDAVCQNILVKMGHTMGEMAAGLIKRLKMEKSKFPLVMGGSVFNGCNPLLVDEFTTVLHKTAPFAFLVYPVLPPVAGAYLCGLDELGIECMDECYKRLFEFFT